MRLKPEIKVQPIYALIILLGFAVFLLRSLDPGIICYMQEIVPETFGEGFQRIGGINDVLAMHIISLFNFKTAGILVLSMMAGLFFLSLQYLFSKLQRHPYFPAAIFTISLFLLLPLFEYAFSFKLTSSILFSTYLLAFATFVSRYFRSARWIPIAAFLLLIYYLFGTPGFYLSSLILIIHPSLPKQQKLFYLLLVPTIPALSMIFGLNFTFQQAYCDAFVPTLYQKVKPAAYAIYVGIPLLIMLLRRTENSMDRQSKTTGKKVVHGLLQFGLPLLLSAAVFSFSFDEKKKEIYQIEVFAHAENWQGVLKNALHFQNFNSKLLHFQINRALYHQGVLLDKLLQYPQTSGIEGLFLDGSTDGTIAQPKADFYLKMGYGNESRHFANEALIARGNKPNTLKCLIINYAAADQPVIAARYLNVLNQSIAHRQWVKDHAGLLHGETNEEVQWIRNNFPERDFFTGLARPENKLKRFYLNNPQNKMAFEYLIANYLITHKVGNIAHEIKTFRQLGYTRLPRLVEEAVLLYLGLSSEQDLDLAGFEISKEAQQDFRDFSITVQKAGGIPQARNAVQHYSHTYWYYVMYSSKISNAAKQ